MSTKIKSRNSLFLGQTFEKPKRATVIFGAQDEAIYTCPYCKKQSCEDECDVMGAEPDCMFCNKCNREFEIP